LRFHSLLFPKRRHYKEKNNLYAPQARHGFQKKFTVNYPKVKAANAALSRKIEAAISYEKNFEFTLKEELGEIQWLEEADYEVGYNKNGILSVNLFITGSGAYHDSSNKTVVVDLKTGNPVKATNVFTNLNGLATKIKKLQQAEIKQGIEEINKDPDAGGNAEGLFKDADFKAENLEEFSIDDKGITFHYDYGFPHVIQALQPDGKYFSELGGIKALYQTRRLACEVRSLIYLKSRESRAKTLTLDLKRL